MQRLNVFIFLSTLLTYTFMTSATPVATDAEKNADTEIDDTREVPGSATPEELKELGRSLLKAGKQQEAFDAFKQCVDAAQGDTAYSMQVLYVADTYYKEKKYDEALAYFAQIKGNRATDLSFLTLVGNALQLTGKNDSAIALLEPVAANRKIAVSKRKEMFLTLGNAYFALEKPDAAAGWYKKYNSAGGIKTADMAYVIALAEIKRAPEKAQLLFNGNIKSFPADYRNYTRLGVMLSQNSTTLSQAVSHFKKALTINDSIADTWFELGKAYQRLQNREDALAAYRSCVSKDDNNIAAKLYLGQLLIESGKYDEAILSLEKAYTQAPDSSGPMLLLATAYTRAGMAGKAVDVLKKIKSLKPQDIDIRMQLFAAYQSEGKSEMALEEINGVLALSRDRETLYPYAQILFKMGKYDEAASVLEEVIGTIPDDFDALMLLAKVYREQKKYDDAVNVYKEVSSLDGRYAPALYERAEVHLLQDKAKWAEMFFQRALGVDPQMGLAEVGLAKVARLFKNEESCEAHLLKAQTLAGDDPAVIKAISALRNPQGDNRAADSKAIESGDRMVPNKKKVKNRTK